MKDTRNLFGFLLRHYRRWAAIDEKEAAKIAGLDSSLWSRYETGMRQPPTKAKTLKKIAKAVAISESDADIKYAMLCRSAGHLSLLPRPAPPMVGLVRYLREESLPSPGYLSYRRDKNLTHISLVQKVAAITLDQVEKADFTEDDLLTRLDEVVTSTFKIEIRSELIDNAFAAFFFPDQMTIVLNPNLNAAETRQAIAHELAHRQLQKIASNWLDYAVDAILGSSLFEDRVAEKSVNWLAAAILLPHPFPKGSEKEITLDLVEYLATEYNVPPELVLCRLCLAMLGEDDVFLFPAQEAMLVRRYPGIINYW